MSTALAIRPKPVVIEFRRCTGHCCDPVTLSDGPGYFLRKVFDGVIGDPEWVANNLIYIGWRSPSKGGWPKHGTHEYRCPHFDRQARRCLIYGQGKRAAHMCVKYPEYERGPWETCEKDGCTRRTMVTQDHGHHLRWRFPDLWDYDRNTRWHEFRPRTCEANAAPECQAGEYER